MTDELIALLREIRPSYGDVGSRDVEVAVRQKQIDRAIELLSATQPAAVDREVVDQTLDDLSTLVVRLVRALRTASPGSDLPGKALDYLYRKNLAPSILRGGAFGEFAAPLDKDASKPAAPSVEQDERGGAPLSLIPELVKQDQCAVSDALLDMGDAMVAWRTEVGKYREITSLAQSAFSDGYEAGIAAILRARAASTSANVAQGPSAVIRDVVDAWDAYVADRTNEQASILFVLAINALREFSANVAQGERGEWFALADGAAASLENAAVCMTDPDAKRSAEGAAAFVRKRCRELLDSEQVRLMEWRGGAGLLWDVYAFGKWSKRIVSPIEWDAHTVYLDMVRAGYAKHIELRLVSSSNRATPDEAPSAANVAQGAPSVDEYENGVDEYLRVTAQKLSDMGYLWQAENLRRAVGFPVEDSQNQNANVAQHAEVIYQTCFMQGQWRDVDRAEYDRAKGLRDDLARTVYAAPPAQTMLTVTPAMVKAAMPWLTGLHHMRKTDKESNVEEAIKAALTAASPAADSQKDDSHA